MSIADRMGRILQKLWKFLRACIWWGLGIWATLALFFTAPGPGWFGGVLATAVVVLFWFSSRESFSLLRWVRTPWNEKRMSTVAAVAVALVAVYYFGFVTPDPNQDWAPEHSRVPVVDIVGDKVHVRDVRNFTWRTATDFTPGFYEREYDMSAINSMYYVVAPMPIWEGVAHVFVCFGFSDGQHVAVSVEGRRVKGIPYRIIPSLFRQYQLIYVVGDERDVVGLRGAIWKKPVFFYPANTTPDRMQAIFVDMMQRAHDLEENPEFYHLITNNCMNNITDHLRCLGGRPLPHDVQLLLTGLSDRVAHRLGYIDTDLPFEQARQAFRVDQWMQTTELDEGFSERLRARIDQQVAEQSASEP